MKNKLIKSQKRLLFIILTVVYFVLLYFFKYRDSIEEDVFTVFSDIYMWPAIFWLYIFGINQGDGLTRIYFNKKYYEDIVSDLESMGFHKYKELSSKAKFRDNNKRWKRNKIIIYKQDNGIWILEALEKYNKHFEKYMIRYSKPH